jgi:hypothetical protein
LSISVFAAWFSGMRSRAARTMAGSSSSTVRSTGRNISSIAATRLRAVTPHQVGFTVISATPANPAVLCRRRSTNGAASSTMSLHRTGRA